MSEKRPGPQWAKKNPDRGNPDHFVSGEVPEDYKTPGYRGSDYPESSQRGFVPVGEIKSELLNPEEALLAKEAGETEEELPEFSHFYSARAAKESREKELATRREREEKAGWSPGNRQAIVESLVDYAGADRVQAKQDKIIEKEIMEKKMNSDKFFGQGQIPRTDKYKTVNKGRIGTRKKAA